MQIKKLTIRNFKSISEMRLTGIEQVLILVGKNNTGKSVVLEAVQALKGNYQISLSDFREDFPNIEIEVTMSVTEEDLHNLHENAQVSSYRNYDKWLSDFKERFPSYKKNGEKDGQITCTYIANRDGRVRYDDGVNKHNPYLCEIIPEVYELDLERNLLEFQNNLFFLQEDDMIRQMKEDRCLFDRKKPCNRCFSCIGLINKKTPEELTAFEASRLLDYKLYQLNLDEFAKNMNENYRNNGGTEELLYFMNRDPDTLFTVTAGFQGENQQIVRPVEQMGRGMRSIYMLSLMETYAQSEKCSPGIILVDEPELFLHPQLQKTAGNILYRLSQKNQIIFTTHSANLLQNFTSRQIRQIVLDRNRNSIALKNTNISRILDDLGYSASDIMNVDFVFIVEGKQDKNRLPLLLRKYYREIYDKDGKLNRVSIITTNSCTNIHTYANLKYMNQIYLRDNFLMIRDGDGKDPEVLKRQLCDYYAKRNEEDTDRLPRVTKDNVLILKYYSFENYFLNPEIMVKVGVLKREEDFYGILYQKWKEYLGNTKSGKALREVLGRDFTSREDMKAHMEEILTYVRGHNLFDIFYGRFRKRENEILSKYIEIAPREEFADILDAIDRFIYFRNHSA